MVYPPALIIFIRPHALKIFIKGELLLRQMHYYWDQSLLGSAAGFCPTVMDSDNFRIMCDSNNVTENVTPRY